MKEVIVSSQEEISLIQESKNVDLVIDGHRNLQIDISGLEFNSIHLKSLYDISADKCVINNNIICSCKEMHRIIFTNSIIHNDVILKSIKLDEINFEDSTIHGLFKVDSIKNCDNISLFKSTIKGKCKILNTTSNEFYLNYSTINEVLFDACTTYLIEMLELKVNNNVTITASKISDFNVGESTIIQSNVDFMGCSISDLYFRSCVTRGNLNLKSCKFTDSINFTSFIVQDIVFDDCLIKKEITLKDADFKNLTIRNPRKESKGLQIKKDP